MAATGRKCFRLLSPLFTSYSSCIKVHQPYRCLSLHEHISQELMSQYGVQVPNSQVAHDAASARDAAVKLGSRLGGDGVFVKAQVLAGGRGKGHFKSGLEGGVKFAKTPEEVESLAQQMIGSRLITKQTGSIGRPCTKVMICEDVQKNNEFYFALVLDRNYNGPVMVASAEGGMDIEEVARERPDKIVKDAIDVTKGMSLEQARSMAWRIGFSLSCIDKAAEQMLNLYKFLIDKDATMLEINPLVETRDGRVLCLDAKINYDDNSKYRQKEVFSHKDWSQEDPRDEEAGKAGINYIGLDGSIGCMVNGAGLAMATMDIIKLYGGSPANFLDIGGGASTEEVKDSFRILGTDPNVKAIFVNVFGGIVRCDEAARGIIQAAREMDLNVPVIIRLQGNNQQEANSLIRESQLPMIAVDDFDTAARKVVEVASSR